MVISGKKKLVVNPFMSSASQEYSADHNSVGDEKRMSHFVARSHSPASAFQARRTFGGGSSWTLFWLVNLFSFVVITSCTRDGSFNPVETPNKNRLGYPNNDGGGVHAYHHHHLRHYPNHHMERRGAEQQSNQAVNHRGVAEVVGNGSAVGTTMVDETPEVIFDESNLSGGFWVRLAQAKVMAMTVENGTMPRLDDLSQIMKPAACGHEEDQKCKEFVAKCADDGGAKLIKNLTTSSMIQIANYMERIWEECEMPSNRLGGSPWEKYGNVQFLSGKVPHPVPVFHCNSHVGWKDGQFNFITNFRMEYPDTIQPPPDIPNDLIPRFFVIELEHRGKWGIPSVQPYWLFRFNTVVHETYRIRVTAVAPKYVYPPVMSPYVTLYESKMLKIGNPVNLRVVNITVDNGAARPLPSALLRWNSGSGFNASCDFDVFYMEEEMYKEERKKGDHAFWVKLDGLQFQRSYSVRVIEKFGGNREADVKFTLNIPSCRELRGYSFKLCPPPPPSNIRLVNATENSFWIVWNAPKYLNATNPILHYNFTVDWIYTPAAADGIVHSTSGHYGSHKVFSGNVPGNVTSVEIKNVTQLRGKFKVSMTAVGTSGSSPAWSVYVFYEGPPLSTWPIPKILILFCTLFGFSALAGLFCILKNVHERRERKKKRQEKFENYEKESLQLAQIYSDSSKWEIDCCSLTLGDAIGQGHFGLVRRATLSHKGRKMTVAVKTLREGVGEKDVEKFWEEFEILKNLDPHVHVVGLKGIVTKHVPLPLLVVEYCDGGDLQTHLRKAFHSPSVGRTYSPGPTTSSGASSATLTIENRSQARIVTNEAYFMKCEREPPITMAHLLSYARQIACGMEYLSTNKIVHRDLAARNILLTGRTRILKISDFGLSRDVYEQNWYKKSSNGEIPIKWLATECLLKEVYTTESDVWSYGILLWEIFTYGGNPYPGVENKKVFDLLKDGYRMPRPEHCPAELYQLMRRCWEDESYNRPDFTAIRLVLEDIIEKTTQVTYLNLESGIASCDEEYEGSASTTGPNLPPRRKLPQIPIEAT